MKNALYGMLSALAIGGCGQSLPKQGDYWLELKNVYGEWEQTALITGYVDDYEACNEFLQALSEWNKSNAAISREYRCTPA